MCSVKARILKFSLTREAIRPEGRGLGDLLTSFGAPATITALPATNADKTRQHSNDDKFPLSDLYFGWPAGPRIRGGNMGPGVIFRALGCGRLGMVFMAFRFMQRKMFKKNRKNKQHGKHNNNNNNHGGE